MRSDTITVLNFTLLLLAAATTLALGGVFIDFAIGHRRLRSLADVTPVRTGPSVSIIAAARNEARNIEAAVTSLLRLDYPALEIIMVNDRSTDETGAILERLAQLHSGLKIRHVSELPEGWLGKNHALYVGAAEASGQLLLFTDADVVFAPTTLRRAVAVMEEDGLDHLTAIPDVKVPGLALRAFVAAFGVFFALYGRPWKARDRRSRCHIGVGAFNLIRADAYRAIGTHRAIAMRPDDDLKLGKLVKKYGLCQDAVYGRHLIAVEWYSSLGELIDGLMKNAFAGVNYSLLAVVASTAGLFLMDVWPFLALFATHGVTRALNGASVLLIVFIFGTSARYNGTRLAYVLAFPAAALLFAYIIWRSALLAVIRGSVTWRGTAYPLAQLRANRV
jgi:glycosyltransferase involved in cell wall biosynthesis